MWRKKSALACVVCLTAGLTAILLSFAARERGKRPLASVPPGRVTTGRKYAASHAGAGPASLSSLRNQNQRVLPSDPDLFFSHLFFSRLKFLARPRHTLLQTSKAPEGHRYAAFRLSAAYGKLPLSFEVNRGQSAAVVKYLSRNCGRGR
jgi:hypothetical protein